MQHFFIFTSTMLDNLSHFITILLKNSNKNNSFMEVKTCQLMSISAKLVKKSFP
jgi:hypothetical protein